MDKFPDIIEEIIESNVNDKYVNLAIAAPALLSALKTSVRIIDELTQHTPADNTSLSIHQFTALARKLMKHLNRGE